MDSNVGAIGYRLFCNEQIPAIKQRIELETGRKAKVSDLQKELSTLWKNLTEQERQICKDKAQTSTLPKSINSTTHVTKISACISPFQNYRIKSILSLDPKMPKFTSSSITLINDAMASFLEQLAHLTDRYMVQRGEKYPIRPQHIVGGINQGDDSVSFLKESIEYINKNQDNGNHRNSVKKARNSEILPYEVTDDAEKRKITKYFKLKML